MEEHVAEEVVFVQEDGLVQSVKKVTDDPQASCVFQENSSSCEILHNIHLKFFNIAVCTGGCGLGKCVLPEQCTCPPGLGGSNCKLCK